jgi:hypothetical protein
MDQTRHDNPATEADTALSSLVGLARLSRLTLLYHGPTEDGGREHAAALAEAAVAGAGDVVVVFDAGSEMRLPDLFSAIEEAVLEARPQAPLAPPMAGPVESMLAWQQALGLRFMLVFYRFDAALEQPDPEFDGVLLQLVRNPALDLCLLLLMDEAAAPRLQRLHADLPELGEDYLRMPDALPPATAPRPAGPAPAQFQSQAQSQPQAPHDEQKQQDRTAAPPSRVEPVIAAPPLFWPDPNFAGDQDLAPPPDRTLDALARKDAPPPSRAEPAITPLPLFWPPPEPEPGPEPESQDDITLPAPDGAAEPPAQQRRRRAFPGLLEQASLGLASDAADAVAPFTQAPRPEPAGERAYRERRPLPVAAWMQQRRSRRRRASMATATSTGMASTVLLFFMLALALVCWELPLLS